MADNNDSFDKSAFDFALNQAIALELQPLASAAAEYFKIHDYLVKVSNHKLNPEFTQQNILQQRGFSGEALHVAKLNADNIIKNKKYIYARTDDLGYVNHPKVDISRISKQNRQAILKKNGDFAGAGQMKIHKDATKYDYLASSIDTFEKYQGVDLIVPADHFEDICAFWSEKIKKLEQQQQVLTKRGEKELAAQKAKEIERYKNTRSRLRKANISTGEATAARLNPTRTVLKESAKVGHAAGLQAAKLGAIIGGSTSAASNLFQVAFNDKDLNQALTETAKDTFAAATTSYAMAHTTTMLSGVMQASSKEVVKNIGKSNLPVVIVQSGSVLAKNVLAVIQGELSPEDFASQITQEGCLLGMSMAGSSLGGVIGGMVATGLTLSGPGAAVLVGSMIGGMVASMLSGAMHNALQSSLKSLDESRELRKRVEQHCQQILAQHHRYRMQVDQAFGTFFDDKEKALQDAFSSISDALLAGNSISDGLEKIADAMGLELYFKSTEELKAHLISRKPLNF